MGEGLRIYLFGEPHFEHRGSAHAFSAPPKTLPLLAYLLLHRSAPSARETIAAALWPESDHAESLANLRRHLHYLNKALPPPHTDTPWVVSGARTVSWNAASPYWLDVETFETESQDQRYRAHAVRLYGGDVYERCADDWIFYERERLRSVQMSNLALLTADARERKAYLQALQYAQLMLALDPWREDALRSVIEIRGLLGDHSGALAEYERFAERLKDELGVAPSEETERLYARLRRAGEGTQHEPAASDETTLLVGRRNELAMLSEEWHRARQGRTRLLLVGGEAGIGKSTLVEALASVARNEGAAVLRGAAAANAPYQAFVEILRVLGGLPLHEIAERQQPGSGDERLQFFETIARLLEGAAAQPTLVVIEDLHLAGAATIDLLRYLITRLREAPVLFAATYREYEVGRAHPLRAMRRQLAQSGQLAHLAVTPLDRESARELLRSRARRPLGEDVMQRIYEAADGNPLFMIETLHQFAQNDVDAVPVSVATIVAQRLSSLEPQARAIAEAAAVAGRPCTAELAAQITGLREGEALRAFDDLLDHHIVREGIGGESGEFAFVHDLVRQSVYEQIPKDALRRRHARLGLVLADLYEADIAEHAGIIAHHLELGGLPEEAAAMHVAAAENALGVYALEEAHYCASKARELSEQPQIQARALLAMDAVARSRGTPEERAQILRALEQYESVFSMQTRAEFLMRRAEVLTAVSSPQAPHALDALRALADRDASLRPHYLLISGGYLQQRGEHERAFAELKDAQRLFQERGDVQGALASYTSWLDASISRGVLTPRMIDEIGEIDERDGDPRTAALLAFARGRALFNYNPTAAYAAGEQMLASARVAEDRWLEALAHRTMGCSAAHLNRFSTADGHLRRAADLILASGQPFHVASVRYHQMQLANRAAWMDGASAFATDLLAAARACGSIDMEVRCLSNLAEAEIAAGELEMAHERMAPLHERAHRYGLGGVLPAIATVLGGLQVRFESPERGINTLLAAREMSRRFDVGCAHYLPLLGLAYLCAGDTSNAQACAGELRGCLSEIRGGYFIPQSYLWSSAQLFHFVGEREHAAIFAQAAYERYTEMLATFEAGPMRDAFLAYRFNRAIVALHEHDAWAPDPLHSWFACWDVRDMGADDHPRAVRAPGNEQRKARSHR